MKYIYTLTGLLFFILLMKQAHACPPPGAIEAMEAIRKIDDKAVLLEIVKKDECPQMRLSAAWKLADQALYAEIATSTNEAYDE